MEKSNGNQYSMRFRCIKSFIGEVYGENEEADDIQVNEGEIWETDMSCLAICPGEAFLFRTVNDIEYELAVPNKNMKEFFEYVLENDVSS